MLQMICVFQYLPCHHLILFLIDSLLWSIGALVSDYLTGMAESSFGFCQALEQQDQEYDGFNLIVGNVG